MIALVFPNTQPAILTASIAAGTFSFAMAAILGLDADQVRQACQESAQGDVVSPANMNGAGQVVIGGARAKELGAKRVVPLPVSAPFHCALMKPAEERLAPVLRGLQTHNPRVPIVDASPKRDGASALEALVSQVSSAVRWEDSVRRLASDGVTAYVEGGPGTVAAVGAPEDFDAARVLIETVRLKPDTAY